MFLIFVTVHYIMGTIYYQNLQAKLKLFIRFSGLMVMLSALSPIRAGAQDTVQPVQRLALKTNLLYDAVLIPNVGIEVNVGRQWTVGLDGFFTWFSSDNRHRYWQGYGGYLNVRRYLGQETFRGHHVGAYMLGLTYDVEWGGKGYQAARFGFGGGVEYGYSMRIGRQLNLDFSLGLGFQDGEYKEYEPIDNHYVWQVTRNRHWWGPTKADISLVWLLGRSNKKKGGQL